MDLIAQVATRRLDLRRHHKFGGRMQSPSRMADTTIPPTLRSLTGCVASQAFPLALANFCAARSWPEPPECLAGSAFDEVEVVRCIMTGVLRRLGQAMKPFQSQLHTSFCTGSLRAAQRLTNIVDIIVAWSIRDGELCFRVGSCANWGAVTARVTALWPSCSPDAARNTGSVGKTFDSCVCTEAPGIA
ncbi:hypothetical protein BCR34DRAFT_171257 [Clohesyomyces aquaticus]|uniref:Uncharacterized protein n=1 Tax=Clohesyomyces aquaticus TaxID=1231657 RepID=A0A1Y1ZZB1_9PLEO|nr:hypothetical protein BCR34DRAFT_171257 [Clohesyomyces aquaticus]